MLLIGKKKKKKSDVDVVSFFHHLLLLPLTCLTKTSTFHRNLSLASSCGMSALQTPLSPAIGSSGKSCEGSLSGTFTPGLPPPALDEEEACGDLVAAGIAVGLDAGGGTTDESLASSCEGTPQRRV